MTQRTRDDPDWGRALAILRHIRGWRQGRLAAAIGIGSSTLSCYELGTRPAPMPVLRQAVVAMGFPPHLLDRAHSLVRWTSAARRLSSDPADSAGAHAEMMAANAGAFVEDRVRQALAAVLGAGSDAAVEIDAAASLRPPPTARRPAAAGALAVALRILRLACGVQRPELSAGAALSIEAIKTYELGLRVPPAVSLQRLLAALGLPRDALDRAVRFVDVARALREARAPGPQSLGDIIADLAAAEAGRAEDAAGAFHHRLAMAARLLAARQRAPELWARLARHPYLAQRALVSELVEFQDPALCELLCDASVRAAGDLVRQALRLARLAVLAAEKRSGAEGHRVAGYCRAHLANALRVAGRLPAADQEFTRAAERWQAGAQADPGVLNEARVLSLEASLRRDQGRLPETLALFDRALAIDRWGETPSLLIGKSKALADLGDFAGSIALLQQAAPLIDPHRGTRNLFLVDLNLAFNRCHLGQYAAASLRLPQVRALARRLGNRLDALRVAWLAARVSAGLGHIDEAVAGFERVAAGFERQGIAYDAALVTLELAELHAAIGRTAEVRALARSSAPIFRQQGVHREARRALDLFRRAADQERATVEMIRSVGAFLQRARRDRTLRYREVA
jgi:transcriptional regulator with XRE-family HTH domain